MVDTWNNQSPTPPHLPRVFEQLAEHQFDGDGNPVMEGTGNRQANVPDPPPLVVNGYAHQLWSTVLGKSLISLSVSGERASFRVYAAGALVAESGGGTFWHVADPVGGTRAKLWVWNNETQVEYQRSEPLGQSITQNAPPEEGFENYTAFKGNVGEPEWQCEIPKNTWGSFSAMPWHCQRNAMERAGIDRPYLDEVKITQTFGASTHSKKKSPFSNQSDPPAYYTGKLSAKLSKFALKATNKDSGSERIGPDPSEVTIKIPPGPPVLPDDLAKRLESGFRDYLDDGPSEVELNAALSALIGPGEGPDENYLFLMRLLDGAKLLHEQTHCLDNQRLRDNLAEIQRLRSVAATDRNGPTTQRTREFGFVVLLRSGYVVVSPVKTSNQEFHNAFGNYNPDEVIAVFHTHPFDGDPSPNDIENAKRLNALYYVVGTKGLTLFNPQNRKSDNGDLRIVKAASCERKSE